MTAVAPVLGTVLAEIIVDIACRIKGRIKQADPDRRHLIPAVPGRDGSNRLNSPVIALGKVLIKRGRRPGRIIAWYKVTCQI